MNTVSTSQVDISTRGGKIVAQGTPEQIARKAGSATGEYLRKVLKSIS